MSIISVFAARLLLVLLFLPFSALDKILNFQAAERQAGQIIAPRAAARACIVLGFCLELTLSLAILTGVADRLAALLMCGYCLLTAVLWKQFWKSADFRLRGVSQGRDLFWDFLKNLAVAGGFLLLTVGSDGSGVRHLIESPLSSTRPYSGGA